MPCTFFCAAAGNLNFTIDNAITLYGYLGAYIISIAADIESDHTVSSRNLGAVNHNIAIVVGKSIVRVATVQIAAVKLHILKRQVAVILDKDFCLRTGQFTILKGNGGILQQLETVCFSPGRANCLAINIIRAVVKIYGKFLAGLNLYTVAGAIPHNLNDLALLYCIKCFFKGRIFRLTDLGYICTLRHRHDGQHYRHQQQGQQHCHCLFHLCFTSPSRFFVLFSAKRTSPHRGLCLFILAPVLPQFQSLVLFIDTNFA